MSALFRSFLQLTLLLTPSFSSKLRNLQRISRMSPRENRDPPPTMTTTSLFLVLSLLAAAGAATAQSPIKTVVVLVMENRSFDHMLGWMKRLNPAINGVDGSEFNYLNASDPSSTRFYFDNRSHYVDPDPGHSFQAIREQIFRSDNTSADPPPMDGFAQQAYSMDPSLNMSRDVMSGFDPDKVAVYKALVSEFAVFDRFPPPPPPPPPPWQTP